MSQILDELVAVHVMGWGKMGDRPIAYGYPSCDWKPSQSFDCIQSVLLVVKTEDRYVEIISHMGKEHWICRIYERGDIVGSAGAPTIPEAVCRAALGARGIKI